MASGAFFNPKTALLVTPLVSSSFLLWYAFDEDYFLKIFTRPALQRQRANSVLPAYIKTMFGSGPWRIIALVSITTWTSVASAVLHKPMLRSRGALGWYVWAAILSVSHLAYIPAVAWKLKWIMDDETEVHGKTDCVGMLERWLNVNRARIVTSDLPTWVCTLVGVMKLISG